MESVYKRFVCIMPSRKSRTEYRGSEAEEEGQKGDMIGGPGHGADGCPHAIITQCAIGCQNTLTGPLSSPKKKKAH